MQKYIPDTRRFEKPSFSPHTPHPVPLHTHTHTPAVTSPRPLPPTPSTGPKTTRIIFQTSLPRTKPYFLLLLNAAICLIIIIYPSTARVVGAPQMISHTYRICLIILPLIIVDTRLLRSRVSSPNETKARNGSNLQAMENDIIKLTNNYQLTRKLEINSLKKSCTRIED